MVQDGARLLRIEPGENDLKNAAPLQLEDLQPGDRILVRGTNGPDGKSLLAVSVIAMKKADIAEKHAHEREEWQRHGVGGLVSAVDPATGVDHDLHVGARRQQERGRARVEGYRAAALRAGFGEVR